MEPFLFYLILPFGLLVVGGLLGLIIQSRHYASIDRREAETRSLTTLTFDPEDWQASASSLVRGSVVMSPDHLRRFLSWLKGIVGGRLRSLEPVLDRGRREAMLRMKEAALAAGHDAILNIRLETCRIASSRSDGKGTTGVELVAYGTGITRARP